MALILQTQHTLNFITNLNFIYMHSIYFISSSMLISTPSLILASFYLVMFTYICINTSVYEYLCLCVYVCMNEYVNVQSPFIVLSWYCIINSGVNCILSLSTEAVIVHVLLRLLYCWDFKGIVSLSYSKDTISSKTTSLLGPYSHLSLFLSYSCL